MRIIQKEKFLNILHIIFLILAGVSLFLVSTRNIAKLSNLMAWDELGYWGSAAYIAGYDWSDIVSRYSGYYSYGYSLIIAVIISIFGKSGIAYEAAVVFNGIFVAGSFYLAYYAGIKVFSKKNRLLVLLASCISTFYANNITQSNMAWTENFLFFLYWIIIAIFISMGKKISSVRLLVLAFFSVYIFVVHNRMAPILIASILTVLLMKYYKSISVKHLILYFGCVVFFFLIFYYFRVQIKEHVWTGTGDKVLGNTMASVGRDTMRKFNFYGFAEMFKTLCCRFFYWGCTTYLTFFVLLIAVVRHLSENFKERKFDSPCFFLFISMAGVFAVMVLTLSQAGSYQALLYGRYQDTIIGPFLLSGFLYFILKENNKLSHMILTVVLAQAVLGLLMLIVQSIEIKNDYFVINCNVNFFQYWQGREKGYDLGKPFFTSVIVFYVLTGIKYLYKKKKILSEILLIGATLFFINNQMKISGEVFEKTYTNYENSENIIQESVDLCKEDLPIYFYDDGENWRNQPLAMWLQYEHFDKKICLISDVKDIKDVYLFIPVVKDNKDQVILPEMSYEGELLMREGYLSLYRIKN